MHPRSSTIPLYDQPEREAGSAVCIFSTSARFINCSSASDRVVCGSDEIRFSFQIESRQGKEGDGYRMYNIWSAISKTEGLTYAQEPVKIDASGVQRPVEMVYRIFDGVVLRDEVDQPM